MENETTMTVREFKSFCETTNIILRDSCTGQSYTKLENYMDRIVHGFYPRFMISGNDGYNAWAGLQIVAWIKTEEKI